MVYVTNRDGGTVSVLAYVAPPIPPLNDSISAPTNATFFTGNLISFTGNWIGGVAPYQYQIAILNATDGSTVTLGTLFSNSYNTTGTDSFTMDLTDVSNSPVQAALIVMDSDTPNTYAYAYSGNFIVLATTSTTTTTTTTSTTTSTSSTTTSTSIATTTVNSGGIGGTIGQHTTAATTITTSVNTGAVTGNSETADTNLRDPERQEFFRIHSKLY